MTETGDAIHRRGYDLEREVASIFGAQGAEVEVNAVLAGSQIDIVAIEQGPSGTPVTTVVECKAYSHPVSAEVVFAFAGLTHLLKQRGMADRAVLVATSGFSRRAREIAKEHNIELLGIEDLRRRVSPTAASAALREMKTRRNKEESGQSARKRTPRIFVAMPFTRSLNDVYILGVREVAERLGCAVERADEVEHNGYIVSVIQDRVQTCDLVIADTTFRNPNVFYEIGYSHALGKPTVLICQEGEDVPFDVKAVNHILYGSIVELREKLERRLRSMLSLESREESASARDSANRAG